MTVHDLPGRQVHERALDLAAVALDFTLTRAETVELEAHLAGCPTCARRVAAMRGDALALGRPLDLLPSARVDAAIAAEIAGRGAGSQRLVLVAAAAMLALALLGAAAVGAYLLRNEQTPPTTVLPLPTATLVARATASTETTEQPETSDGVTRDTWRTVGIPASDTGTDWIGLMKAVAATESGFVAVGPPVCAPQDDPTTCHTSVWTATQGGNWIRAIDQPSLRVSPDFPTSGPSPAMSDVTAGPGGLVAIGYDTDPQARGPAVWRSTDGRTWTRVDQALGSKPAERLIQRITAVAAGARGYVIVGHVIDYAGGPADVTARAAAWTSPDGVTWTRATDTADMDVGACVDTSEEPACGGMLAVTATDTGYIAVGQAAPGSEQGPRPSAWKSSDGIDWVRIDAGLGFSGRLDAVTRGGGRVVATGRLCTGSSCSGVDAVSSDEVSWRFAAVDGVPWEGAALTSAGDSVVGIAWNLDDGAYQVWRTTDGLTREKIEALPLPAGFHAFESADIAASGERILVVGWLNVTVPSDDLVFGPVNVSFQSP